MPLTTRPSATSKHGMMRLVSIAVATRLEDGIAAEHLAGDGTSLDLSRPVRNS